MTTATPRQQARGHRSYRCAYSPLDRNRVPLGNDTGVLPTLQVQARDAEEAQRLAFATIGCPIVLVERLETTQPLPVPEVTESTFGEFEAALAQPLAWPAAPLTQHQLRRRAAQESAMQHGRVARWPQGVLA